MFGLKQHFFKSYFVAHRQSVLVECVSDSLLILLLSFALEIEAYLFSPSIARNVACSE